MERWQGFLGAAKLDLAAASCERDELWVPAAFHWQQAAEKSLKALLSRAGIAFPPIHDLRTLTRLTEEIRDIEWPNELDLFFLTSMYETSRYPIDLFDNKSPSHVVSKDFLLKAAATARMIHERVADLVKDPSHDPNDEDAWKP